MRAGARVLTTAILVCAFAYGLQLLRSWIGLPDYQVPVLSCVALAVFLVATPLLICKVALPARRAGEERAAVAARETTWHLCAVGIYAWSLVFFQYAAIHDSLPEEVLMFLSVILLPFSLLFFLVPMFMLFSVGIGILALGKAKSRRAKWIVALVDFSAPVGYAAFLWGIF